MTGHPSLPLVDPFTGHTVEIDVEMAPVISTLWSLGVETVECCQGTPGVGHHSAVICFAFVGRVDCWGLPCSRFRKGKQGATRLVMLLHDDDPAGCWRTWGWKWDDLTPGSAVLLPNEELPLLASALARIERAAAGQLALDVGEACGA